MIPNRDQRAFLDHLHAGRVYRSAGDLDMVELHPGDNRRCAVMLREFTGHEPPLAVLAGTRYELTDAGQELRAGVAR